MGAVKAGARRPAPDDFAQVAPQCYMAELKRRYHAGEWAIRRWEKETGVRRKRKITESKRTPRTGADNDDVRDACLTCPYKRCIGRCDRVLIALARSGRGQSRKYQIEQKIWLIDRWLDGYGIKELADFTGISDRTIAGCIRGTPPLPPIPDLPPLESLRGEWEALVKSHS